MSEFMRKRFLEVVCQPIIIEDDPIVSPPAKTRNLFQFLVGGFIRLQSAKSLQILRDNHLGNQLLQRYALRPVFLINFADILPHT